MAAQPHLLIVDDQRDIRDMLEGLFLEEGYQVSAVGDAVEARALLEEDTVDVMLVDVVLPGERGIALADHAARLEIPVLLISGHPDVIMNARNQPHPMLVKPFSSTAVVDAVDRLAGRDALRHQAAS
jgi:DNA-binding NtrC family response regulator